MHRLDIDELADSKGRAFAAIARTLDSAERRPRVRPDVLVDEAQAGFELLGRDSPSALEIRCQDARAEAELARVGDPDRVGLIGGGDDRGDRPEQFFVMRRLARQYIGKHGCRVPGAGPIGHLASEQEPCTLADAFRYLVMDFVPGMQALHRPELRPFLGWIAHPIAAHRLDHRLLKVSKYRTNK